MHTDLTCSRITLSLLLVLAEQIVTMEKAIFHLNKKSLNLCREQQGEEYSVYNTLTAGVNVVRI